VTDKKIHCQIVLIITEDKLDMCSVFGKKKTMTFQFYLFYL